jgi:pSer/pThr/pTyr-binding forkhead associated (FHA) protein
LITVAGAIGFVLRFGTVAFPLGEARLIAGRTAECDIFLDAVSVSRKHAAFTARERDVLVEDLTSRNGVYVNGVRLVEPVTARIGDRIVLGSAVLVVALGERGRVSSVERRATAAPPGIATYRNAEAFPIFLDACARALAMGKIVEAAAGLEHLFQALLEATFVVDADPIDPQIIGGATTYLLDLAERTGESLWLDRVFDLRRATGQPLDPVTLRRVVHLLPKLEGPAEDGIRRYIAWMQGRPLGVAERLALRRLRECLSRTVP